MTQQKIEQQCRPTSAQAELTKFSLTDCHWFVKLLFIAAEINREFLSVEDGLFVGSVATDIIGNFLRFVKQRQSGDERASSTFINIDNADHVIFTPINV